MASSSPIATLGLLEVDQNGDLSAYDSAARQFTSLAGISFPVPQAAHTLTLDNGWQSAQGLYTTGDPSYSVSGGVVYLSGSVRQPISGNDILTVLPKAARPKHDLYIKVMVYTPGTAAQAGTLFIAPDGAMNRVPARRSAKPSSSPRSPGSPIRSAPDPVRPVTPSSSPGKARPPAAPSLAHLSVPKIGRYQHVRHEFPNEPFRVAKLSGQWGEIWDPRHTLPRRPGRRSTGTGSIRLSTSAHPRWSLSLF